LRTDDQVFKALADPSRRSVLDALVAANGQTLSALCERLAMKRQSAAQHIDILIAANLISTVWRGREKLHFLNPVPIHEVYDRWAQKFERRQVAFLHDLKTQLEETPMAKTKFVHVTYIAASAERIWAALVTPDLTRVYWGYANVSDWRPGSTWRHVRDDDQGTVMLEGLVIEADPPRRLAMTWAEPERADEPSRVTIELEPMEGSTRVKVVHDDLAEKSQMAAKIGEGWPRVLSSLKSYLETGKPLITWGQPKTA